MNACPSRRRRSSEKLVAVVIEAFGDPAPDLVRGNAILLQRIAVADRDSRILIRLAVNGYTKGRADFVLPAITAPDRAGFLVEHGKRFPQLVRQFRRELRHAILLHERKNPPLDGRESGPKLEDGACLLFARNGFFLIAVHEQSKERAVRATRGLDDVRDVPAVVCLIDVFQLLARELLMLGEVEVAAVVHALEL